MSKWGWNNKSIEDSTTKVKNFLTWWEVEKENSDNKLDKKTSQSRKKH